MDPGECIVQMLKPITADEYRTGMTNAVEREKALVIFSERFRFSLFQLAWELEHRYSDSVIDQKCEQTRTAILKLFSGVPIVPDDLNAFLFGLMPQYLTLDKTIADRIAKMLSPIIGYGGLVIRERDLNVIRKIIKGKSALGVFSGNGYLEWMLGIMATDNDVHYKDSVQLAEVHQEDCVTAIQKHEPVVLFMVWPPIDGSAGRALNVFLNQGKKDGKILIYIGHDVNGSTGDNEMFKLIRTAKRKYELDMSKSMNLKQNVVWICYY